MDLLKIPAKAWLLVAGGLVFIVIWWVMDTQKKAAAAVSSATTGGGIGETLHNNIVSLFTGAPTTPQAATPSPTPTELATMQDNAGSTWANFF